MAPPTLRGAMVSMYEVMLCAGMLLAVVFDYSLSGLALGVNWRVMVGIPAIFACVQLLVPCLLPESPHWLVSKGKSDEALSVLKSIYANKVTSSQSQLRQAERELMMVAKAYRKTTKDDAQMFFSQSQRCCNGCACLRGCECVRNLFRRMAAVSVELWSGVERRATRLVMIIGDSSSIKMATHILRIIASGTCVNM